jgi:hypothetical protein
VPAKLIASHQGLCFTQLQEAFLQNKGERNRRRIERCVTITAPCPRLPCPVGITRIALLAVTFAAAILSQASGRPSPGSGAPGLEPGVTETCLEQNKPACLYETVYLDRPDGSNNYAIKLVWVSTGPKINSQNKRYDNMGLSPEDVREVSPGFGALPAGANLILRHGARPPVPAQLISIKKMKPSEVSAPALSTNPPVIAITSPTETVTSRPMINVQGISDHPLRSVWFDVLNSVTNSRDQQGLVTDSFFDTALWQETTNYWECLDIVLAPGTNTIVVHCEDLAGRVISTNFACVFRLDDDKTPPRISVEWPPPGIAIGRNSFFVHGQLDDPTAVVVGQICGGGETNIVRGLVERYGHFWVEKLPLAAGTNFLTITATDAAGNSSVTNEVLIRSDTALVVDRVPARQLWQLQVTVTGWVRPSDQDVWVNGRRATVGPDGTWMAVGVPVSEGTAVFQAKAVPKSRQFVASTAERAPAVAPVTPVESVSVQSVLPDQNIVLNINQPAYGGVKLHMTGTAGKSFVLSVSTNLVDWTPVLTNLNAGETFDYADGNSTLYGCRFFRTTLIH